MCESLKRIQLQWKLYGVKLKPMEYGLRSCRINQSQMKLQSVKDFSDCSQVETRGFTDANAIETKQKITNGKIIYYNWIKNTS